MIHRRKDALLCRDGIGSKGRHQNIFLLGTAGVSLSPELPAWSTSELEGLPVISTDPFFVIRTPAVGVITKASCEIDINSRERIFNNGRLIVDVCNHKGIS